MKGKRNLTPIHAQHAAGIYVGRGKLVVKRALREIEWILTNNWYDDTNFHARMANGFTKF